MVATDSDSDGFDIGANALTLNGGSINDFADVTVAASLGLGSNRHSSISRVNGAVRATVSSAAIASSPASGSTYRLGEQIEVAVTFEWPVTVTGTPRLALGIGTEMRQADYASGTGTNSLTFRYTVQVSDTDTDGISVGASALTLTCAWARWARARSSSARWR